MKKNSITNKITPCCNLPFSVIYWWVSNLTLNSEADRSFILSQINQNGTIRIDGWKVLINSGTLEADASLTKAEFLAWFDCGKQPKCEQLKLIIEGYKMGSWVGDLNEIRFENVLGVIKTTDTAPTTVGLYRLADVGTYTNLGGLVTTAGKINDAYFDGTTWSLVFAQIPNVSVNTILNPSDNTKGSTDKAIYDFFYGEIAQRENGGENTQTPQYLGTKTQINSATTGIRFELDTESPTKDILPYKRVFYNTLAADKATNFSDFYLQIGTKRPSIVSISYWAKKSEWADIWKSDAIYSSYFGLAPFEFENPSQILTGVELQKTVTPNIDEYSSATAILKVIETKTINGIEFIRIGVTYKNIVWKPTFNGTTIRMFFLFNYAYFYNKELSVYDYTILFDTNAIGDLIYNGKNNEFLAGVFNLKKAETKISNLESKISLSQGVSQIRAKRSGDIVRFAMPFSTTQDLVVKTNVFRNGLNINNNVNIESEYLIEKNGIIDTETSIIKSSDDDIAPNNLNNSYIAGNHGWNQPIKITKTAHGKTFADIGKLATDSNNKEFTIIKIVDENTFVLCSKNQATDGYSYNFIAPVGDLTFQSGVVSGYTQQSMGNTYGFLKSSSRKVLANGVFDISDGEEIKADFFDVIDIYDVYDLSSVVDTLIANANYSSNPDYTNIGADKLFRQTITYRFVNSTMLINQTFFAYKKINLSFLAFIQMIAMSSGNLYINKILPISDGVKTYDFRIGEAWTNAPASRMDFTKVNWENTTNPPDRFINYDTTKGIAIGFIKDKGYAGLRQNNTSAGWVHTSKKIYPYYKKDVVTMEAFESISAQSFRSYINRSAYNTGKISEVIFENNNEIYIILDYNGSIFDTVKIPKSAIGKEIIVIEKTANVKLLSDVATSEINISVTVDATNVYGYVVLKIK